MEMDQDVEYDNNDDNLSDLKNVNEQANHKKLYDQHILECQKRKDKGNREYESGNYGRASFEYKIALSYIQPYEKDLLRQQYNNLNKSEKSDKNQEWIDCNNKEKEEYNDHSLKNNNPDNSILDMIQKKNGGNHVNVESFNEEEKEIVKILFVSLYLNLAQIGLKKKQYTKTVEYASQVIIQWDSFNTKALYRRAIAHLNRGDVDASKKDLQSLQKIENNMDVQTLKKRIEQEEQLQQKKERKCYQNMFLSNCSIKNE